MTDKRILYTRPDGAISVVIPAPDFIARFKAETQAMKAIQAKDVPDDATNIVECRIPDLPTDRTFRGAWKCGQTLPVTVDMVQARAIHMARIRVARQTVLAGKDVEWMKAVAGKDQAKADLVEAERQVLRDLPQTVGLDKAATPDELKALWPMELQ